MILLLLGCVLSPPTDGKVSGRTWSSGAADLAVDFPPGWQIVMDPELFRGGQPGTVWEARHGELQVALSLHPAPAMLSEGASSLDLMHWLIPVLDVAEEPTYRMERVVGCPEVVHRQRQGFHQLARRTPTTLALFSAWGSDDVDPLITLACERSR